MTGTYAATVTTGPGSGPGGRGGGGLRRRPPQWRSVARPAARGNADAGCWRHDRRSARRRPLVGRPPLRPARVGRAGRPAAEGSPESAASDAEILRLSPLHQYFLAVPPRLLRVMDTFLVLRSESILLLGGTRLTRSGCKTISNIAARTVLSASVCTTLLMCLKFCNSELAL
jgi:hypothetical protein